MKFSLNHSKEIFTCSRYCLISSNDLALFTANTHRNPSPPRMYWSRIALQYSIKYDLFTWRKFPSKEFFHQTYILLDRPYPIEKKKKKKKVNFSFNQSFDIQGYQVNMFLHRPQLVYDRNPLMKINRDKNPKINDKINCTNSWIVFIDKTTMKFE